jgi:Dehydrogenases with different specificities (related to short-chain alcohol dehydrogenases)
MTPLFDFSQRTVVISGAVGNLGRACAERFTAQGARLVLLDRGQARLQELFGKDSESQLLLGGIDSNNPEAMRNAKGRIDRHFGAVDVLVHTVGGFDGGASVAETPDAQWDSMLNLNLRSAVRMTQTFVPDMAARRYGRLVFIGARAGLQAQGHYGAYAASKAALLRMVEAIAQEHAHDGITANAVLPGVIDTPQNRAAMPAVDPKNWVRPEAIAITVAFLSSSEAADISGVALPVYGRS